MNSIDDNNRCKTIYGILLVLFIIAFNCIWLNKAYPMAEGWAEIYSGLLDNGKIPYKDFYYYLPPLNLLIDYIIWKLSFGFIVIYRLWRLLERIAIIGIIYKILINNMKPFYALLVSLLGCFIGSGCCYDLCGDYNQTEVLTALLLGLSLIKYIQYPDNPK